MAGNRKIVIETVAFIPKPIGAAMEKWSRRGYAFSFDLFEGLYATKNGEVVYRFDEKTHARLQENATTTEEYVEGVVNEINRHFELIDSGVAEYHQDIPSIRPFPRDWGISEHEVLRTIGGLAAEVSENEKHPNSYPSVTLHKKT